MRTSQLAWIGACVALSVTLSAQDIVTFDVAVPGPDQQAGFDVIALDPLNIGPVVANAPYSAEAITEFVQVLADGNRIERRTSGKVARNAQGRVRREQQGVAFGPFVAENPQPIVTISDPTTGVHLVLNYDLKVAFRTKLANAFFTELAPPPEAGIAFGSVTSAAGTVTMQGGRMFAAPPTDELRTAPMPPPPEVGTWVAAASATAGVRFDGDVRTEPLEPTTIEGLKAEGTRTIMTFPAGSMGNVLPIEVISERWFSPELKIVLMTRRVDPRFGDTVYKLTNIDRSEPPADLFKVPAGFKTEDSKPGFPMPIRPQDQWQ